MAECTSNVGAHCLHTAVHLVANCKPENTKPAANSCSTSHPTVAETALQVSPNKRVKQDRQLLPRGLAMAWPGHYRWRSGL